MHTILQRPIIEETPVSNSLNDFREIDGWTVEEHCQLHKQDLAWLNSIVNAISVDSERKIVIFTHYSLAFGHTHFNCDFVDEATGKRLYTNQKGYWQEHSPGFREGNVVHVD
ncbi:calcineurin-like phosphoesterase [Colletotrichum abscissum]|uniref:calcineurin-like phosphoesterase n=1 Tax=Colletotrichum abscissum TaxID=1671311 RepID=UPI0027D4C03F|nr:calcineurin-like phosphoesterase [Colletotrichum abscissum]KAK1481971.1 calcineurin-like phosphoesterase [Colletotrichum abscissum]